MSSDPFDRETAALASSLPPGARAAILGSSSFHHPESAATCDALGRALAAIPDLVLLTGGVTGIVEAVGRSFHAARCAASAPPRVFHLLPRGAWHWDFGEVLLVGADMRERREVLGRAADVYVVLEGGPGTAHETAVARARGAPLLPVGRSGGEAASTHAALARPPFATDVAWATLASPTATPAEVARTTACLVRAALGPGHGPRHPVRP